MNVTREMFARACKTYGASEVDAQALMNALEAALADVPSDWWEWSAIADERLRQLTAARHETARLQRDWQAAEAKLAAVRAYAANHAERGDIVARELLAILDGEP